MSSGSWSDQTWIAAVVSGMGRRAAADAGSAASRARATARRRISAGSKHGHPRLVAAPAQLHRAVELPVPRLVVVGGAQNGLGGDEAPLAPLGQLGQPRGLVDGVADHRVLEAFLGADVARDEPARRHPDPEGLLADVLVQALAQLARRRQRAARGVVQLQRRPEHTQRRVALELVDPPVMAAHDVDDDAEEPVEQPEDLLRRALGGQRGRADEVDEEHGRLADLAAELDAALERLARDVLADVAAEEVAQALVLAQ